MSYFANVGPASYDRPKRRVRECLSTLPYTLGSLDNRGVSSTRVAGTRFSRPYRRPELRSVLEVSETTFAVVISVLVTPPPSTSHVRSYEY